MRTETYPTKRGRPHVIHIEGEEARVELTQGQFAKVDAVSVPYLIQGPAWIAQRQSRKEGEVFRAVRRPSGSKHGGLEYLHRVVTGAPDGVQVDHINGDQLDNRRVNLRQVQDRQNKQNMRTHREGQPVGVCYEFSRRKWKSCIKIGSKSVHLGRFATAKEAHQAYLDKARELQLPILPELGK